MAKPRRKIGLVLSLLVLVIACVELALARKKEKANNFQMDEQKRAEHALNRLAFGPRPGDVSQITAMGVDKWIDLQLHPEKINDDALESRLVRCVRCAWMPKR